MRTISIRLTDHTYEKLKVLAGDEEDYLDGYLDEANHAEAAAAAVEKLLEWAIRGLYGATGPAPFRCPLTLEGETKRK